MGLFISKEIPGVKILGFLPSYSLLYAAFLLFGFTLLFTLFWYEKNTPWAALAKKVLLILALPVLIFCLGYSRSPHYPTLFKLAVTWYFFTMLFLVLWQQYFCQKEPVNASPTKKISLVHWGFVIILSCIFFFFGFQKLGDFAAVDEPLWLYGRIPRYFSNFADGEWSKTAVSDKPGITVALISGAGLLFENPRNYETKKYQGEVRHQADDYTLFFKTFRLPILVFLSLFLPVIFFLTQRVFGTTTALINQVLLATSPVLIGMSKIINPDSLLWAFSTASILAFLALQKTRLPRYLIAAGVFLGLALLTKYIANILLVFFVLSALVHFVLCTQAKEHLAKYWQEFLCQLFGIFGIALFTFYIFLPAAWIEPSLLIESTFASQAFEQFSGLFLLLVALLTLEVFWNKGKLLQRFLPVFSVLNKTSPWFLLTLFTGVLLYLLLHVWQGFGHYNFSELLASPKTVSGATGALGIFLSNFYVGFFSETPAVALGLLLLPILLLKKLRGTQKISSPDSSVLFIVSAILLYYLASVLTGVASIIRYQIILVPFFILLSAYTYTLLIEHCTALSSSLRLRILLVVLLGSGLTILIKTPFPGSYASSLLPKNEVLDVKDMGPGSYEAALFLNNLPDAQNLTIWTDKSGVCNFFVGRCLSSPGKKTLADPFIDYVVVSSTRQTRITNMTKNSVAQNPNLVPLPQFYLENKNSESIFTLAINGRPNHTVKIFPYHSPLRAVAEKQKDSFDIYQNAPTEKSSLSEEESD
jgi:hypothetical protein